MPKTTGEICPMDSLVGLLEEFKYHLILDESHSFGVLGQTGRGVTELFNQVDAKTYPPFPSAFVFWVWEGLVPNAAGQHF